MTPTTNEDRPLTAIEMDDQFFHYGICVYSNRINVELLSDSAYNTRWDASKNHITTKGYLRDKYPLSAGVLIEVRADLPADMLIPSHPISDLYRRFFIELGRVMTDLVHEGADGRLFINRDKSGLNYDDERSIITLTHNFFIQ